MTQCAKRPTKPLPLEGYWEAKILKKFKKEPERVVEESSKYSHSTILNDQLPEFENIEQQQHPSLRAFLVKEGIQGSPGTSLDQAQEIRYS
ncbi:hypothetical protein llap_9261 [Limosa lapponica baueri]|uniref:Uncharacterized protein n=1 Tax=Limosa lapponica baueri TaxID=1758121 RepID=A0A2I0U311_LIMLA|nr:hypothetical protein llap_9261 [Limosa lapponica baueri]